MEDEGKVIEGSEPTEPTAEEFASLKTQLEAKTADEQRALSRVQGLEGSLKEKDRIIKGQSDTTVRLDTLEDMIKILATHRGVQDEELRVDDTQRPDINKAFDEVSKKREEQTKLHTEQQLRDDYNQKANAIFTKAREQFKDDGDSLDRVELYLERGKLDKAEELLAKEVKKEVKVEKSDIEKENEDLKKKLEKYQLTEEGELKSEMGLPAGAVDKFTLDKVSGYTTKGKSNKEMKADAEKLLDQLTK